MSQSAGAARPFTVLVVDDEPGIRDFLTAALESEGYTVYAARDGAEALEAARRHEPDVILLDLLMPVMDGRTFASVYRRVSDTQAPIIAMSASSKVLGLDAKLPEVYAHFDKPFELEDLFEAIEAAIAEYRAG